MLTKGVPKILCCGAYYMASDKQTLTPFALTNTLGAIMTFAYESQST